MVRLADAVWTDLEGRTGSTLLVPVGSCEQHGPHLPFDTDTRIAVAVATGAARPDRDLVAPAVTIGASGEHRHFPGTLSIGTEVLQAVLVEVGRSALPTGGGPFGRVVFVNGHGGNVGALEAACELLVSEGRAAVAWWPRLPGGDAHAGRTETSLMLAIEPGAVGPERPVGNTAPLPEVLGRLRTDGVRAVSANGVLGDAGGASVIEGRDLLARMVDDLRATVAAGGS